MLSPGVWTTIALSLSSVASAEIFPGLYSQTSTDQSNVLRYLAGPNPFIEHTGYGIPLDTPQFCEVTQVHLHMRHGERYPTSGASSSYINLYKKLKNAKVASYTGPLAFVEDLEYFTEDPNYYDSETFKGPYSGYLDAFRFGSELRQRYDHLVDTSEITPLFTSSSARVVETARTFGKAFFGFDAYAHNVSLQIISEKETQGYDTITPAGTCPKFDGGYGTDYVSKFPKIYFQREAERLNTLSPGFNITADDIPVMAAYCGYEINARGASHFCGALSMDAFVANSYYCDLTKFYSQGPGNNLSAIVGSVGANATLTLLKQGPQDYKMANTTTSSQSSFNGKVFLNFFHDTDMVNYLTALDLFEDYPLPNDQIDFQRTFKLSEIVPMGARLITERLVCNETAFGGDEEEVYVRTILNDKVIPLGGCSSGPGYSCALDDYSALIHGQMGNVSFADACGISKDVPQYTKFYWNWEITFENN